MALVGKLVGRAGLYAVNEHRYSKAFKVEDEIKCLGSVGYLDARAVELKVAVRGGRKDRGGSAVVLAGRRIIVPYAECGLHKRLALGKREFEAVSSRAFAHGCHSLGLIGINDNGGILRTSPGDKSALVVIREGRILAVGIVGYSVASLLDSVVISGDAGPFCIKNDIAYAVCGDFGHAVGKLSVGVPAHKSIRAASGYDSVKRKHLAHKVSLRSTLRDLAATGHIGDLCVTLGHYIPAGLNLNATRRSFKAYHSGILGRIDRAEKHTVNVHVPGSRINAGNVVFLEPLALRRECKALGNSHVRSYEYGNNVSERCSVNGIGLDKSGSERLRV